VGHWRVLGFFLVCACVITWPQVIRFDSIPDHEDAFFSLWRLGWITHALTTDPRHLFDGNIFYPERYTLAYSDGVLVEGLVALPFLYAGMPVVYVYNALVLGSFVACGMAMYLLARRLTGSTAAALLAGVVFAFAPFRFDHYYHLELLWSPWMPLAFWFAHRTVESGRLRDGIGTGLCVALQVLSSIYYGVFLATALVVLAPVLVAGRLTMLRRRALTSLACGAVVAVLLVLPYMAPYWFARDAVGERNTGEALLYGAGPRHYLAAMPDNLLMGSVTGSWGRPEKRLFPGVVAVALLVVALWPPVTRTKLAYALVLAVAVNLSFGPRGLGYEWLREYVVLYRGLRAPARLGQVALLAFAMFAAIGASRLHGWLAGRRLPADAVMVLLIAVALAESLVTPRALRSVPTAAPPAYAWLAAQRDLVIAELPMPSRHNAPLHEAEFQFLSTFHWHPLLNGYSGNWTDAQVRLLDAVDSFPSPASLAALEARGASHVLLHERFYGTDRYRQVRAALEAHADVEFVALFGETGSEIAVYRLPSAEYPPRATPLI
jgi:hypothetical protein